MFNLARSLDRNADLFPDADAMIFRGTRLTHAGLLERVSALAAAFADAGIGRGDIVALFLGNRPEFLETALAVNRIGAAFLPLNVRLAVPELEYIVGHSGARAIVTEQALAAPVAAIAGRLTPPLMVITVTEPGAHGEPSTGMNYESFLDRHLGTIAAPAEVGETDLHRLMYSSGTTSRPKGVPITYGNFYWKTIAHVAEFGISSADRTLMAGPMYHVGAFDLPGIGTWWVGGSLVIIPRFDVADLLATIERERPSNVWLAPAMVNALLQAPELGRFDTSSIRFIIGGGEKMPVTLIERLLAAFPNGRFADAYGLTETVAGDTFLDQAHTLSKIGSVGKPVLNLDVRIAEPDDPAVDKEPGQSGEILLRGPKVVSGYWKDPAATAAAFTPDGWLRTGDVGHIDKDGYLYIDDRKKDMIVSGGENVASSEVERVLYEHDAVLEAAVVAMPDPKWGEVPRAFIVLKPGRDVKAEALIGHCRARLAGFKTPKEIVFLDTLPRTPSGKVLKRELRQPERGAAGPAGRTSDRAGADTPEGEQQVQTAERAELSTTDLIEAYGRMTLIRTFEERVSVLYRDGEVPGFVHLSIGQEASAVGACWALGTADVITSNHRGHGHCLAKGLAPEPMMAELLARATGTNKGLGGSMHIADPSLGIFGANGIVAAGVPIAAGAGVAAQLRKQNRVVVSFFGDGAVAQGAFHEAANLASLWKLPIVFFCENNGYAEFSPLADQHPIPLSTRAAGYGMEYVALDGNDVESVATAMSGIVGRVRDGAGPVFVEATTYRWHGHYEGDPERYRSKDELSEWRADRDPVAIARARLVERGVAVATLDAIDTEIGGRIEAAVAAARQAPVPDPSVIGSSLYALRPSYPDVPVDKDAPIFKTMDAVRLALEYELEHDPEVFLAGVDVGKGGNVFALTRGLYDRWPERLLDTPISETAVMGLAVGAAMAGMRPVVELMYLDFLGVCFDQILNQAAKLRFMTGGNASMGLTIRTQFGGGRSSGSQHSQSLEALLAHIPGLTVVMPSTPADTYGLLRAAIRDPNPVIFIENRQQYGAKGPKPPADYLLPLGKAKIVRPGTDVTVVSVSRMVHEALAAADALAKRGISAEVIDLRTVAPLDKETILESLSRTGRLVVAHEAVTDFGIGAEIAAVAAFEGFWKLDAPVRRVAPPPTPVPYAPNLEKQWLPDRTDIERAIEEVVRA